jgi:hypothetical protein
MGPPRPQDKKIVTGPSLSRIETPGCKENRDTQEQSPKHPLLKTVPALQPTNRIAVQHQPAPAEPCAGPPASNFLPTLAPAPCQRRGRQVSPGVGSADAGDRDTKPRYRLQATHIEPEFPDRLTQGNSQTQFDRVKRTSRIEECHLRA